jgi:hypothetical protein
MSGNPTYLSISSLNVSGRGVRRGMEGAEWTNLK